jgi:hypothetical protein
VERERERERERARASERERQRESEKREKSERDRNKVKTIVYNRWTYVLNWTSDGNVGVPATKHGGSLL